MKLAPTAQFRSQYSRGVSDSRWRIGASRLAAVNDRSWNTASIRCTS